MAAIAEKPASGHSHPSPLKVVQIDEQEEKEKIAKTVKTWQQSCNQVKASGALSQLKEDYGKTSGGIIRHITHQGNGALFASYDNADNLQGAAIVNLEKSRKRRQPFVEINFLLTAFPNTPLDNSKEKVRGAGASLIAKAIQFKKDSKCIFVSSEPSAEPFYKKMGFVPTRRQVGLTKFKLTNDSYSEFNSSKASHAKLTQDEGKEQ